MKLNPSHESILILENLFFPNIIFKNPNNSTSNEFKIELKTDISMDKEENTIITKIIMDITNNNDDDFQISITAHGEFKIKNLDIVHPDMIESMVKKNTISILFPYIRSQVTLLTSQPNFTPIIIPVINVNNIVDNNENNNQSNE